jgi:hypothetical protein
MYKDIWIKKYIHIFLFTGVNSPVCVITGVQQLSRSGWSELRNISDVEFPLTFYKDEQHTFLQVN